MAEVMVKLKNGKEVRFIWNEDCLVKMEKRFKLSRFTLANKIAQASRVVTSMFLFLGCQEGEKLAGRQLSMDFNQFFELIDWNHWGELSKKIIKLYPFQN
jgi:hypothetical protein